MRGPAISAWPGWLLIAATLGVAAQANALAGMLVFATVMTAVIALHEAGHALAARALGVRVTYWAIGSAPRLITVRAGDAELALGAIPLGGVTGLDATAVAHLSRAGRLAIALSGVVANVLTASACWSASLVLPGAIAPLALAGIWPGLAQLGTAVGEPAFLAHCAAVFACWAAGANLLPVRGLDGGRALAALRDRQAP